MGSSYVGEGLRDIFMILGLWRGIVKNFFVDKNIRGFRIKRACFGERCGNFALDFLSCCCAQAGVENHKKLEEKPWPDVLCVRHDPLMP